MLKNAAIVEKINFCVLIAGIIILIALFPNKRLNYDEPFSIMCSKGITNLSVGNLKNSGLITSAEINAQNTYHNVFQGGDSFYYVGLHYFTPLFNNSLASYVAYSIIWSILALIAFYWAVPDGTGQHSFHKSCHRHVLYRHTGDEYHLPGKTIYNDALPGIAFRHILFQIPYAKEKALRTS